MVAVDPVLSVTSRVVTGEGLSVTDGFGQRDHGFGEREGVGTVE